MKKVVSLLMFFFLALLPVFCVTFVFLPATGVTVAFADAAAAETGDADIKQNGKSTSLTWKAGNSRRYRRGGNNNYRSTEKTKRPAAVM